ncbi:hypothetical protein PGT21_014849 [Puccinia graminis f. sp. tritici]|uniref:Uncharacterized protein n=1 Tax=Puccinia graminis f. sp. tritici TaxID=56615 RepID=A0A5B0MB80_PUCGR|nr:hypothetical protein PGT21_014849 [Puccinia graminis f. sp. tritici]
MVTIEPINISTTNNNQGEPVDILILGAGWVAGFLISYIDQHKPTITYRTTTTKGGGEYQSIPFKFDPNHHTPDTDDVNQFRNLPHARSVLISFPIKDSGASRFLVSQYLLSRRTRRKTSTLSSTDQWIFNVNFIQLGSSGIFDGSPTLKAIDKEEGKQEGSVWIDRDSEYDKTNPRAISEDELLQMNGTKPISDEDVSVGTTVLNLSGLWGGTRSMRRYVGKIAATKEALERKTSLHMIHGLDVARAILAVVESFDLAAGQRWILTDQRIYDWWDLASAWGESSIDHPHSHLTIGPQADWVNQLMQEHNVRALPRSPALLGRAIDSRQFWTTFGLTPVRARMEDLS